ncbi:MAG: hypothetical protein UR98_C0039G0009 [Parcubacteria group bacterium GW2011_GWA1_36_12]|nr:MAG: hypothetical protein UR98_C0039G0009 [Parcubacteria group bacterium GW2011_GWA1_36_12]
MFLLFGPLPSELLRLNMFVMTDDDIKKIKNVVKEEIKSALKPVNNSLEAVKDKLDNHTAALMKIEDTLEGYADMYKINKEKNEELEERVEIIEDKLAVSNKN